VKDKVPSSNVGVRAAQPQLLGGTMRTDLLARSQREREWKFVHFLAASAAVEVVLLLILRIALAFMGSPLQTPLVIRVVAFVGGFLLLWFWVRMVVDFVRNRPEQHAAAWGWALFLAAFLGALAYFVAVWRPRNQSVAA
jgi:hypothetical protein